LIRFFVRQIQLVQVRVDLIENAPPRNRDVQRLRRQPKHRVRPQLEDVQQLLAGTDEILFESQFDHFDVFGDVAADRAG